MTTVKLKGSVDVLRFERVLQQEYDKSLTDRKAVTFDLREVEYIELLPLSQLLVWVHGCQEAGIPVTMTIPSMATPETAATRAYLRSSEALSCLVRMGVHLQDTAESGSPSELGDLAIRPFAIFDSRAVFENHLEHIGSVDTYSDVFAQGFDAPIVSLGVLRDVIVRELGNNNHDHGGSRAAHYAVTKVRGMRARTAKDLERKLEARHMAAPVWKRAFLDSLGILPRVEVVVGDAGPGVLRRLKQTYLAERKGAAATATERELELEVLKYAFEYGVSSRSTTERVKAYARLLADEKLETIGLATGLWRVRDVVRHFRGLIEIRSGRTLLAMDYSVPDKPEFYSAAIDSRSLAPRHRTLCEFPGTQVLVTFPVTESHDGMVHASTPMALEQTLEVAAARVISVATKDHVTLPPIGNLENRYAEIIEGLSVSLRTVQREGGDGEEAGRPVIILDVEHLSMSDKAWFLMFRMVTRMPRVRSDIVMAVGLADLEDKFQVLRDVQREAEQSDPAVTAAYDWYIVDASLTKATRVLDSALLTRRLEPGVAAWLSDAVWAHRKQELGRELHAPVGGIEHEGRFVIPGKYYMERFFEVGKVSQSPNLLRKVADLWAHELLSRDCWTILVFAAPARSLAAETARRMEDLTHRRPEIVEVEEPIGFEAVAQMMSLPPRCRIAVVVDVIGRGGSLNMCLTSCEHLDIVLVLTVVDLTGTQTRRNVERPNGHRRSVEISAVYAESGSLFDSRPPGWPASSVQIIDSRMHRPLPLPSVPRTEDRMAAFLRDGVATGTVLQGHLAFSGRHFTLLFAMDRAMTTISGAVASEIAATVSHERTVTASPRPLRILHNARSPGARALVQAIAMNLQVAGIESIEAIPVAGALPIVGRRSEQPIDALVVDTVVATGETFKTLIDYAAACGAQRIWAWGLISRLGPLDLRFFSRVKVYDEAQVTSCFVFNVSIPGWLAGNCPVCLAQREISNYLSRLGHPSEVRSFLQPLVDVLEFQDVLFDDNGRILGEPRVAPDPGGVTAQLRNILAEAFHSETARQELTKIIVSDDPDDSRFCALLVLLGSERWGAFRHPAGVKDILNNDAFDVLIRKCAKLIDSPVTLSTHPNIISALAMLCGDRFRNALPSLLEGAGANPGLARVLSLETLKLCENSQSDRRFASALDTVATRIRGHSEVIDPLPGVVWELARLAWRTGEPPTVNLATILKQLSASIVGSIALIETLDRQRAPRLAMAPDYDELLDYYETDWKDGVARTLVSIIGLLHELLESPLGVEFFSRHNTPSVRALELTAIVQRMDDAFVHLAQYEPTELQVAAQVAAACASEIEVFLRVLRTEVEHYKTEFGRVVNEVIEYTLARFPNAGITVRRTTSSKPLAVVGTTLYVRTIVNNLVENVFKHAFEDYAEPSREISVLFSASRDSLELVVSDNGIATDAAELQEGPGLREIREKCHAICARLEGPIDNLDPVRAHSKGWRVTFQYFSDDERAVP